MSESTTTQLNLPFWDVGSRKIRFMYLVNLTSFRLTEGTNEDSTVPLFLGADLFANSDIRTENHPRYHAKFAKKGLATKINFSSAFRFHGLRVPTASNSLWFYSIQGLFRVAFEMYCKQEQLAVLENFQDIWKSRINDSPLDTSYNVSEQLDHSIPMGITHDEALKVKPRLPSQHCQMKKLPDMNQTVVEPSSEMSEDHDYCGPPEGFQTEPNKSISSTLLRKLHSLEENLFSICSEDLHKQETILVMLENIAHYIGGTSEERAVTETVLSLLDANHGGCVYSSPLLNSIARWLGQQFYAANSSISQQVEGFKVQHIEQITNLPPAEELATELFPEAMRTLLLHWMGLSDESAMEKRHSEYPILLLILEFANHNLITGVAHVLYSSLICK